jgi:hypothetical protein
MAKNTKKFTISINHHICPIFHAENNLSKLKFNFAHFIGPILTLRGPAPFVIKLSFVCYYRLSTHFLWKIWTFLGAFLWTFLRKNKGNLR